MSFYIEIAAVLLSLVMLYLLYHVVKAIFRLLINSLVAVVILFLLNMFFGWDIVINIWSVLVVALSGFAGLVLVLVLHFLGLAF